MVRFLNINKVAVAVMAVCTLFVTSCEEPVQTGESSSVSVKNPRVDSAKGQMFVNVKCPTSWKLMLTDEAGADVGWANINPTSGTGDKNNVILSYQRNTSESSRKLQIRLDDGRKMSSCEIVQAGSGGHPVEDPDIDPTPGTGDDPGTGENPGTGDEPGTGGGATVKAAWLELPAMDNPALGYYSHSFQMNGKTYRNYSFGWSQKDRVALWVAYPLCPLYLNGNAGRTNAWALDPLLGEDSAAPFGGYAGDYARGHQLPSADRQCSEAANAQTFYGTNMTPQLNAHNEGIWSNLEGKVRTIAQGSDTTYVVTGVMVSATSKKEKDSYGQSVTIPDAYFKAMLRYSKTSTLGQWNAAAFYLEHRNYSESLGKSHSMSIDELEEITGIDFFVNLPAKIGEEQAAKVEATNPANVSLWW